jgi:hypothetical protein
MAELLDFPTLFFLVYLMLSAGIGVIGLLLFGFRPIPGATEWGLAAIFFLFNTVGYFQPLGQPMLNFSLRLAAALTAVFCGTLILAGTLRMAGRVRLPKLFIILPPVLILPLVAYGASGVPGTRLIFVQSHIIFAFLLLTVSAVLLWQLRPYRNVAVFLFICLGLRLVRLCFQLLEPSALNGIVLSALLMLYGVFVLCMGIAMYRCLARQAENEQRGTDSAG